MQLCPGATTIFSDFLGLVKLTDAPWLQIAARQHVYAGLQVQIRGAAAWDHDFSIVKVPAHVKADSLPVGSLEWFRAVGNDWADRYAKKGALTLAQPSKAEIESWVEESASLKRYLRYAARALLLISPACPLQGDPRHF